MKNKLSDVPQHLFDVNSYFGGGRNLAMVYDEFRSGNGKMIQRVAIDVLTKKGFNIRPHASETDFYDCVIDERLIEIRRTSHRLGNGYALYMGNTSQSKNTTETRKEKVQKLKKGGYILVRITNKGKTLKLYWFPTKSLLKEFGDVCYTANGINIKWLSAVFDLDIPEWSEND